MKKKEIENSKVGLFVLSGIVFLILMLYMIGRNRNLFGSTFTMKVMMTNVNGLVSGNNVRFKGIDVGTVESISIETDSSIYVTLVIDNKMKPYIKKNAIATIGTDGIMGNKLININSQGSDAVSIEEGDLIYSRKAVETDEMLRTLSTTNSNMERISHNLYEITIKLNNNQSLWMLLSDTIITQDIKSAISEFRKAGLNTAHMTNTGKNLALTLSHGNGLIPKLFTDTTLSLQLANSIQQIEQASKETVVVLDDLKKVIHTMEQGEGTASLILRDTVLRENISKSGKNIEQGTEGFNQNMEALKSNVLFKGYFKNQEKKKKKSAAKKQ